MPKFLVRCRREILIGICLNYLQNLKTMKKSIFQFRFLTLALLVLAISLSACKKDKDPNPNPSNGTADDYFPTTTGSKWTYSVNVLGQTQQNTITFNGNEKIIEGNTYREIEGTSGGQKKFSYARKENGNYHILGDLFSIAGEDVEGSFIHLKDNVPVNTKWTKEISQVQNGFDVKVVYTMTIKEKNINRTVRGKNYQDVINVELNVVYSIQGLEILEINQNNYFAKKIGLIQSVAEDFGTQDLVSYEIKQP
jgi:hypothetical protein